MNSTREEALFPLALTKPAHEQAEFLDRECRNDAGQRARPQALLAAYEQPDQLFAAPAEGSGCSGGRSGHVDCHENKTPVSLHEPRLKERRNWSVIVIPNMDLLPVARGKAR